MSKEDYAKLAIAILIGCAIGYLAWRYILKDSPCYDGTPIADTPNYCLTGARR